MTWCSVPLDRNIIEHPEPVRKVVRLDIYGFLVLFELDLILVERQLLLAFLSSTIFGDIFIFLLVIIPIHCFRNIL